MTPDISLRPSADVIFRELEGEAVLLDLASGRYFGLNGVGTRVWMLLEAGSTPAEVVSTIAAEFDAAPGDVARDVDELLAELKTRGLLVSGTAPPPAP